jgi:hypothetical protein
VNPGWENFYYVLQKSFHYFVVCNIVIVTSIKIRQFRELKAKSKDGMTL